MGQDMGSNSLVGRFQTDYSFERDAQNKGLDWLLTGLLLSHLFVPMPLSEKE